MSLSLWPEGGQGKWAGSTLLKCTLIMPQGGAEPWLPIQPGEQNPFENVYFLLEAHAILFSIA